MFGLGWISVKNALPPAHLRVLATDGHTVNILSRELGEEPIHRIWASGEITHWMRLPAVPEGGRSLETE